MPKKPINTEVKQLVKESESKSVMDLADKVIFTPTPRQRQIKAKFWSRFVASPFVSLENLPRSEVEAVTKSSAVKEWWGKPGFKDWFINKEEARERLEYLFMKCLDTAEDILEDPEAQPSAKVNMIKVIAELANKFPSKAVEKYADEDINKMDEKQLKGYLERKGVTIKEEKVIDVSPDEKASNED